MGNLKIGFMFCLNDSCSHTTTIIVDFNGDYWEAQHRAIELLKEQGYRPVKMMKAVIAEPDVLCEDEDFYFDEYCENMDDEEEEEGW